MNLASVERYVAEFFLPAALVVTLRLLWRGRAWWRGLSLSPEGLLLFLVSMAVAGDYLWCVLRSHGRSVPPLGTRWLWAFGLSSAIYLAVQAARTPQSKSSQES
jgi:hypothetical protein